MTPDGERRSNSLMEIGMAVSRVEAKVDSIDRKVEAHLIDDKVAFKEIKDDYKWISRGMWIASGGISVIVWIIVNFAK